MSDQIQIIAQSDHVERLFAPLQATIGQDYAGYRNHVYRVLSYAMHFLNGDPELRELVEAALVYHDIGLWTDHELGYLEPSEAKFRADAVANGWQFDVELGVAAIHWHHKVTPYKGPNERVINAVRRADWIDATEGKLRKGLSRAQVKAVEAAIPNEGFHDSLQRLAKAYGGSALRGNLRVLRKVFKL